MMAQTEKGANMKVAWMTIGAVLSACAFISAHAAVSNVPLLSNTANVRPNIALVLDTSGSMEWDCIYAKQVSDALIVDKVGNGVTTDCIASTDPRQASPVNNLLFYNPKTTYQPGYVKGVQQGNAALISTTLTLYLPKPTVIFSSLTTSTALKDTKNYDKYEVTSTAFKKNGNTVTGNPFGAHGGSRTDCANLTCTLAEERQNYANWSRYHSDRIRAAKTGISAAFVGQTSPFRLAYGTIYDTAPNTMTNWEDARTPFFTWLDARVASGGTPLRNALNNVGKYYQSSANSGPWGSNPPNPPSSEKSADHLSCRRSYAVLITDGFYNDSSPPTVGNVDVSTGTLMTYALDSSKKYQYKPGDKTDPRSIGKSDTISGTGGNSNTLADIAMKYWVTDLRTDLANDNGKGTPTAPPFWQNMSTYMVSFGVPGTMSDADVDKAKKGLLNWVTPKPDDYTAIDDMRHAAHNGGGAFLTVNDAAQFERDFGSIIGSIASQQFSQAGVAASAVTLTAGTKKFIPYFTSGTWWGNLEMVNLNAAGDNDASVWKVIATDANGQPTGSTTIPTPASRKIYVWANASSQAVDFTYSQISNASNNFIGTNANMQMTSGVSSDIIDYLRGVRTKEGAANFRTRPAILGDITNSTPAFIKNNTNPQYDLLPTGTPGLTEYATYMATKAARNEGVLMIGANDGMLHAFAEGYGTNVGGREIFAYVPRSVLGKLEGLVKPSYSPDNHRFMVDGPLIETDAYVTTPDLTTGANTTGWRNIVIGTTGAGAKSVFALNVTSPFAMNGRSVLWELNADSAFPAVAGNSASAFQELGHVFSTPQSGITRSGDWVTIFGNGFESKSGQASLFIVDTGTGKLIREIKTDSTTGNGLGGVRLVLNQYKQIIGVYAGDLKGRLWKFDLNYTSTADWKLGNDSKALFTAMSGATPLPITAAPAVLERTDQAGFKPSYLVSFSTGKLFAVDDEKITTPTNMSYGIWDRIPFGTTNTSNVVDDSMLEPLKLSSVTTPIDPKTGSSLNAGGVTQFYSVKYLNTGTTSINWTTRRGWKLTLELFPGMRTIYPVSQIDEVVKIDTVAPTPSASGCKSSDSNAVSIYIDPLTGVCRAGGTFDTNGDGVIDDSDGSVCSYSSVADGMDVVLKILDSKGVDTHTVSVQSAFGQIKVRTGKPITPPTCSDPNYAAAHSAECNKCLDPVYAAAHPVECNYDCTANPGTCPASIMNRAWRQIFPRANN